MIGTRWLEQHDDVIVAPATPHGRGALALVRLSGVDLLAVLRGFVRPRHGDPREQWPPAQTPLRVWLMDGEQPLDDAVLIYHRGPATYTGQDLAELSLHGNPLLVERCLQLALRHGARPAQPGEFTLRALVAGKLDLVQAEAVEQLVSATSMAATQRALAQLRGTLSQRLQALKEATVTLLAHIEMALDFPEEDDAPLPMNQLLPPAQALANDAETLAREAEQAAALLSRQALVICGPPNAGKSTLFNALVGAQRAIVSHQPGTTRDALYAPVSLGGQQVDLVDTAGIRADTQDEVEEEGIRRAWAQLDQALLALVVVEAGAPHQEALALRERVARHCPDTLLVRSKADLAGGTDGAGIRVCALRGEGLETLREAMESTLSQAANALSEAAFMPTARQLALARRIAAGAARALDTLTRQAPAETASVDLRDALHGLQELLGEHVEADILGEIFTRFCIGK